MYKVRIEEFKDLRIINEIICMLFRNFFFIMNNIEIVKF